MKSYGRRVPVTSPDPPRHRQPDIAATMERVLSIVDELVAQLNTLNVELNSVLAVSDAANVPHVDVHVHLDSPHGDQ